MVLTKKEESSGSGLASLTGYGSADEPEEEGKKIPNPRFGLNPRAVM